MERYGKRMKDIERERGNNKMGWREGKGLEQEIG